MLRRHQCIIDLQKNILRINQEEVPFLSEKDIPEKEKNNELTEEQTQDLEKKLLTTPTPTTAPHPSSQPPPSRGTSQQQQQQRPQPQTQTGNQVMEGHISQLMSLGYTRQQVIEALTVCNGNPELAGAYLFQM